MSEIKIDRLTLNLSGLSAGEGERLARKIAAGLSAANLSNEKSHRVEKVQVNTKADEKADVDKLSEQIIASVLSQLERSL